MNVILKKSGNKIFLIKKSSGKSEPVYQIKKIKVTRKDGTTFYQDRKVRIDPEQVKEKSVKKDDYDRIKAKTPWWKAMMPINEKQYQQIQEGNLDELVNYTEQVFWKKSGEDKQVSDLINSMNFFGTKGFSKADVIQEVAIALWTAQAAGRLTNVPFEKFPSFVASIFARHGRKMARNGKIAKEDADNMEKIGDTIEAKISVEIDYHKRKLENDLRNAEKLFDRILIDRSEKYNEDQQDTKTMYDKFMRGQKFTKIAQSFGKDLEGKSYYTSNLIRKRLSRVFNDRRFTDFLEKEGYIDKNDSPEHRANIHKKFVAVMKDRYAPKAMKSIIQRRKDQLLIKGVMSKINEISVDVFLIKAGEKAKAGDIRTRKDGSRWQKQGDGKWIRVKNENEKSEADDSKKNETDDPKKEEMGAFDKALYETRDKVKKSLKRILPDIVQTIYDGLRGHGAETAQGAVGEHAQVLGQKSPEKSVKTLENDSKQGKSGAGLSTDGNDSKKSS